MKNDFYFKNGKNPLEIQENLIEETKKSNYSPLGYFLTDINLIQKHWLNEEIKFRLNKYNFKKINIEKLELDWKKQIIGFENFKNYPKLWFWIVKIKV
ncbi:MAG: hypothetical protein U9N59_05555 [Campylobacterota bacterium]|nr:hypothetical protein [Campylobacterota bacterium]